MAKARSGALVLELGITSPNIEWACTVSLHGRKNCLDSGCAGGKAGVLTPRLASGYWGRYHKTVQSGAFSAVWFGPRALLLGTLKGPTPSTQQAFPIVQNSLTKSFHAKLSYFLLGQASNIFTRVLG